MFDQIENNEMKIKCILFRNFNIVSFLINSMIFILAKDFVVAENLNTILSLCFV